MNTAASRVPARVGLLGNPSDGFGGRVIAATIDDLAATVTARRADRWHLGTGDGLDDGHDDGAVLLEAAVAALVAEGVELMPCRVSFETTIPRQVGLSGSSAIVIAAIRAVAAVAGHTLEPVDIARIALAAEVEGLGWAAGPQDRVVQSFGGVLDMRFDEPWNPARYERLDPAALPPLVVAWDLRSGAPSGTIHAPVRERWERGDRDVVAAMERFAALAAEGRAALDAGRARDEWPALADEAFALRERFWTISDRDRAMVDAIRDATGGSGGAALAGSGGAVVAHLPDAGLVEPTLAALGSVGAESMALEAST